MLYFVVVTNSLNSKNFTANEGPTIEVLEYLLVSAIKHRHWRILVLLSLIFLFVQQGHSVVIAVSCFVVHSDSFSQVV